MITSLYCLELKFLNWIWLIRKIAEGFTLKTMRVQFYLKLRFQHHLLFSGCIFPMSNSEIGRPMIFLQNIINVFTIIILRPRDVKFCFSFRGQFKNLDPSSFFFSPVDPWVVCLCFVLQVSYNHQIKLNVPATENYLATFTFFAIVDRNVKQRCLSPKNILQPLN